MMSFLSSREYRANDGSTIICPIPSNANSNSAPGPRLPPRRSATQSLGTAVSLTGVLNYGLLTVNLCQSLPWVVNPCHENDGRKTPVSDGNECTLAACLGFRKKRVAKEKTCCRINYTFSV
jgi:hypothetical protein